MKSNEASDRLALAVLVGSGLVLASSLQFGASRSTLRPAGVSPESKVAAAGVEVSNLDSELAGLAKVVRHERRAPFAICLKPAEWASFREWPIQTHDPTRVAAIAVKVSAAARFKADLPILEQLTSAL